MGQQSTPWLTSAIAKIGKLHDGPDVPALAQEIAHARPQEADYWGEAGPDTAWCGIFLADNLVKAGIPLPKSPSAKGVGGMWVDWWLDFGSGVPVGQEQPGDVAIWLGSPHHVSFVAGNGQYVGGNQSDGVTRAHFRTPDAIRRPPSDQINVPPVPVPFVPLDKQTIDAITTAAARSDLATYSWHDRGHAPVGYIKGMAVTYGMAVRRLAARDSVSIAMTRVVDGEGDVFDHYSEILIAAGIVTADAPDIDRLRALWVILTGLGMRESSGNYSEGRDTSAPNTSADTAEAGLFQQSWNSHTTSPEIPKLLESYVAGNYPSWIEIFREGVNAKQTDTFGEGVGAQFQETAKKNPAFACEVAAIGMRTLYTHWGPLVRHEAEVVPAADALFRQVQDIAMLQKGHPMPEPEVTPAPDVLPVEHPEIKIGATGPAVVELQKLLGIKPQSGFFDNPTDAAVRAFQAAHNLDVDGEVGAQTWPVLIDPSKAPAAPVQFPEQLPATIGPSFDLAAFVRFIDAHKDEAHRALTTGIAIYNTFHPDKPIVLPSFLGGTTIPPTAGDTTPVLQKPSVQLSAIILAITSIFQSTGHIGLPFGIGGPELSTFTGTLSTLLPIIGAGLGVFGVWGKIAGGALAIIAPLIKAAADAQTPKK